MPETSRQLRSTFAADAAQNGDSRVLPRLPERHLLAESEGLVTKEPLRGCSATSLVDRESIEDLYELRLLLEPWVAARAAARITDEGMPRLEAELSGNAQVRAAFQRTHAHLHLFRLSYGQNQGSRTLDEHREIVRAIATRSPREAERAMRKHVVTARERLLPMAD